MNRFSALAVLVAAACLTVGCATKNYVRNADHSGHQQR